MERPIATHVQIKRFSSAEVDRSRAVQPAEPHLHSVPRELLLRRRRRTGKTRVTVYLSAEVIETLRDIAYWTKGTVAGLVEEALRDGIAERERLNGGPFARRLEELKGGRPRRRTAVNTSVHA